MLCVITVITQCFSGSLLHVLSVHNGHPQCTIYNGGVWLGKELVTVTVQLIADFYLKLWTLFTVCNHDDLTRVRESTIHDSENSEQYDSTTQNPLISHHSRPCWSFSFFVHLKSKIIDITILVIL